MAVFAAGAVISAAAFGLTKSIAKWVAIKALLISLIIIVLPWVLKGHYKWIIDHITNFIGTIATHIMTSIDSLSGGVYDISLQLTGVGGYIASRIGFIEYCSIIFTGWAAYLAIITLRKFTPWI